MKHRPKVETHCEDTEEGEAVIYRVTCPCGETFPDSFTKTDALAVRNNHRAWSAPPETERCGNRKAHHTRWWDACPVCVNQLLLPGFEEITA